MSVPETVHVLYHGGDCSDGLLTLTWTMRLTPARTAASKSTRELRTASSKVVPSRSIRTQ